MISPHYPSLDFHGFPNFHFLHLRIASCPLPSSLGEGSEGPREGHWAAGDDIKWLGGSYIFTRDA